MTNSRDILREARNTVDNLAANGALFTFRAATSSLPSTFTYEVASGGDRQRCRRLIASAKGDAALWSAVVAEISRRCDGGAG